VQVAEPEHMLAAGLWEDIALPALKKVCSLSQKPVHACVHRLCVEVLETCAVSVAQARHKPDHCHSNLTNFANSFDPGKCDSLPLKQSACYSMSSIAERRA